jgi:hypothetical protein
MKMKPTRSSTVRTLAYALVLAVALAAPAAASADDDWVGEPPSCGDPTVASLAVVDCEPVEAVPSLDESTPQTLQGVAAFLADAGVVQELPAYCRLPANVVFYTATDWVRLAETMATDASPCAEYYFSIPALANDKTELRGPLQPGLIRALGPRFHAMAEIHLTGWSGWVAKDPARTWCAAGVEARRRMEEKNYLVELGDTWSINELSSAVRRGDGNSRQNFQEFVRCLYDGGDGSLAPAAGNVFVVGLGQGTTPTTVYKAVLRGWLAAAPFWNEMARSVRWWGQEAYGSPQFTFVPETSRNERSRSLSDYLYAVANLAESGPDEIAAARDYLRSAHYPLANAAWRWTTGFGFTEVPVETMQQFVSLEEYTVRHTLGTRPQGAVPFVGYAWALRNVPAQPQATFQAETLALARRLASSIRFSLAQGGSAPPGACGPPGEHIWCGGAWEGATFNAEWALLTRWDD